MVGVAKLRFKMSKEKQPDLFWSEEGQVGRE